MVESNTLIIGLITVGIVFYLYSENQQEKKQIILNPVIKTSHINEELKQMAKEIKDEWSDDMAIEWTNWHKDTKEKPKEVHKMYKNGQFTYTES